MSSSWHYFSEACRPWEPFSLPCYGSFSQVNFKRKWFPETSPQALKQTLWMFLSVLPWQTQTGREVSCLFSARCHKMHFSKWQNSFIVCASVGYACKAFVIVLDIDCIQEIELRSNKTQTTNIVSLYSALEYGSYMAKSIGETWPEHQNGL